MIIALHKRDIVSKMVAIVLAIVCCVAFFYLHDNKLNYIAAFVCGVLLLIRAVKDKFVFIFYLFICSYLFFLYSHYVKGLALAAYSFNSSEIQDKTLFLFSLFLVSCLFFYKHVPRVPLVERLDINDNAFIFYINLVFQILIIIFGTKGQSIFEASYGTNAVEISTINNYYAAFYLAGYFSSGRVKGRVLLLNTLAIVYCANSLALGGRGATISMALVYFLMVLEHRISFGQMVILMVLGFLFMTFWGFVRAGRADLFFSLAEGGIGNILGTSSSLSDKYTVQGGHYTDIFYASTRIVGMTDTGVIDLGDRIYAFFLFIASVILPYSVLPPIANLASYLVMDYTTLGGGLAFAYFYTFMSYFGVVLLAYLVSTFWNKLRSSGNKYVLIYCILAFAFMNGWFAYNPITLFKLCLWGAAYVYVLDVITANLVRKNKVKSTFS